ncbi:MAG: hypothetical protein WCA77_05240 [Thermoplasmata archaeon]
MENRKRTWLVPSAVAAALLIGFLVVPSTLGTAQAMPASSTAASTQMWAYGGQRWVNTTVELPHANYTSEAFVGWQVIYTSINTSSTTVELTAQRTLGVALTAEYCAPSCQNPTEQAHLLISGSEVDFASANLSTTGTVDVNGSAAAAVALLNAASSSQAHLSEKLSISLTGINGTKTATGSLDVVGAANASVNFGASGLGLVPWTVMPGEQWNASAAFTSAGAWALNYTWARVGFDGVSTSGTGSPNGSAIGSGVVDLQGTDLGNVTLSNGQSVPRILLVITGPFEDADGIILIPHAYDIFGTASQPYAGASLGGAIATTAEIDFSIDHIHHVVRIVAAATSYQSSDSSVAPTEVTGSPSLSSSAAPSATDVQAEPESVGQAQAASQCYVANCEVGTTSPSTAAPVADSGLLGIAIIGLIAVAVVGTVGLIGLQGRRRARARTTTPPGVVGYSTLPSAPLATGPDAPGTPPSPSSVNEEPPRSV